MPWVVFYFNPENLRMQYFKADFNQKLFSNTLGSNSSLGLKTHRLVEVSRARGV
jgi:hypothetical protein